MRPKKRILLVDYDEYRLSVMRFRLVTHSYAVLAAASAPEGRAIFASEPAMDVVIVASDLPDRDWLLKELHAIFPYTPQMVLAPRKGQCNAIADVLLHDPPAEVLLQHIKAMSGHKRGPHPKKPVVSVGRMQAEAASRRIA